MNAIRLVVVDDSNVVHLVLEKIINGQDGIEIVGQAYDGQEGVDLVKKLSPDVIVMDINMPGMNGLQAIQEIMSDTPTPIIVFSSASKEIVDLSFKSIELGAVDIIEKPYSNDLESLKQQIQQKLVRTIRTFADFKVMRRLKKTTLAALGDESANLKGVSEHLQKRHEELTHEIKQKIIEEKPFRIDEVFPVIGIAASTGGPQTIRTFVENIHFKHIYAGIVIVQHMAEGFLQGFCDWLGMYSPLPVSIAQNGQYIEPCHLYIAPGEYHLGFSHNNKFMYIDSPPILGIRPSANVMFTHMAKSCKKRLIAIILTGMGNDGVEGLAAVKKNGGFIITQDEESCILYGMPKAAIDTGLVDKVLPLKKIPEFLVHYCSGRLNKE